MDLGTNQMTEINCWGHLLKLMHKKHKKICLCSARIILSQQWVYKKIKKWLNFLRNSATIANEELPSSERTAFQKINGPMRTRHPPSECLRWDLPGDNNWCWQRWTGLGTKLEPRNDLINATSRVWTENAIV